MALTESAGAAWATANASAVTSGSFTPGSNNLLVALAAIGNGNNSGVTSISISDSVSGSWTQLVSFLLTTGPMVGVFVKDAGASPSAQTVTATFNGGASEGAGLVVRQFSGAKPAAQQNGVTVTSGVASTGAFTGNITPGTTGSQVVGAFGRSTSSVALTANGSTSIYGQANGSGGDTEAAIEASSLSTASTQITLGFTNGGTGSQIFALAEILPGSGTAPDFPAIQPGPTWFDTFKPGMRRPRPVIVSPVTLEQGPLAVTLPPPVTSLSGTDVNPASLPAIAPGPTWFDTFKPGMRRPRTPVPPSFAFFGETGPLNVTLPAFTVSLTGVVNLPLDVPRIQPGPTWFDLFKPGLPRPRPPVPPVAVRSESGLLAVTLPPPATSLTAVRQEQGPLAVLLPAPVTSLSGGRLRTPENLGAVLTLPSPNGVTVEVTESATCILPAVDATLVLPSPDATLVGWTMLTAPLTLSEFNDVTIDIAVTQNGSPYNLTGVTVNLLFKSQAGTPDGNALIFSSGGGSPAITITNAAGGLAVAVIPNTDLDAEIYFFYRLDVVNAGLTNTCLYGPITWISL